MVIPIFFLAHWQVSVFCQSFFLHRYGAHKQFTMSPRWERFFHLLTYVAQGSSFLSPRAYAILHRKHHAFSDTPKDPHSPHFSPDAMTMMLKTKHEYDDYAYDRVAPEARFYTAVYWQFATAWWHWLLLPVQWVVGPVHGAIVNWCGHKYGYQNFDNGDRSRNMLWVDFLTAGELFQNNHHKFAMSPNFAARWFEIDPTYFAIRVLSALKIIQLKGSQRARYPMEAAEAAE
jgi:stearoyl-CoA desaturase (delta-9 desaturase)